VFGLPDLVTLVLVDQRLPRANAAKEMRLGASAVLAATIYILGGLVEWLARDSDLLAAPVIALVAPTGFEPVLMP